MISHDNSRTSKYFTQRLLLATDVNIYPLESIDITRPLSQL